MEKIVIHGSSTTPLKGEVIINGAKNSAVALLPAALLVNRNLHNKQSAKYRRHKNSLRNLRRTWS